MGILDDILSRTRADARERATQVSLSELEARCRDQAPARDFVGAVRRDAGRSSRRQGPIRLIAEVKRRSPSQGVIRADLSASALARGYAEGGANAISVLTDGPFFQGSLDDLAKVCLAVNLPILRKDFHVDPYQLWEARAAGADAVLLIVAALGRGELEDLLALSRSLGLAALVEVHTVKELDTALQAGADLVGINNRDLKRLEVSLETTFGLLPLIPGDVVLVSESGISQASEVARLASAGVDAILVGEGLLRHADVGQALRRLMGTT